MTDPIAIDDGLAVYRRGAGSPVLLLPYPHASGDGPMVDDPLADLLVAAGFEVATFDPPGQYRSTRPAEVTLAEMLDGVAATQSVLELPARVDVVGHSMGALCAFLHALERPDAVDRLVLLGTPPGSGWSLLRYRAMPFHWPPWHPDLWRMVWWGVQLASGRGNLATHKRLDHLLARANVVDQSLVPPLVIEPGDDQQPPPGRDRWWLATRDVRLVPRAAELRRPTLLLVGRHDPQTPVRVSRALARRMPDATLVVCGRSGHAPHVEEPSLVRRVLEDFLGSGKPRSPGAVHAARCGPSNDRR